MIPTFQAQNPAISGCPLGWSSCTCFAGAMAAAFDQGRSFVMKGCSVRTLTHDTSGGTTLAQVDLALLQGWDVNLNTIYRLPWDKFAAAINSGKGAILQGWYGPIADSKYDAGRGFRGNHAVVVLPGWIVIDPLADGRAPGVYKFHQEKYPQTLLKSFAGKLNIGGTSYRPLGAGLVYTALTHDKTIAYEAHVDPGTTYTRYVVGVVNGRRRIIGHHNYVARSGFTAPCTSPKPVLRQTINEVVRLVKIEKPGSPLDDVWISAKYMREV